MADALAFLREWKLPFDATWGSLQVAGDRGAPPIPLGGGTWPVGEPALAYSSDQTRLFSQGKWVRFAWTDRQIREDLVRTVRVVG